MQAEPGAAQRELVAVLRALVTVQGGTPTARPAPLSALPCGVAAACACGALRHPEARTPRELRSGGGAVCGGEGSGRGSAGQRDAAARSSASRTRRS